MKTDPAIQATDLTRRFGRFTAVDHVSFAVERGEIFGFLGPNGAGKTTTVRVLTGVIAPTGGTATIEGRDVVRHAAAAREGIGTVPEEANVYIDLTVWQNMMLMGELHGVGRARRSATAAELLEQFGLSDRRKQKGKALSKGLRQRLMVCMALVSEPSVLFLDEPTGGLDVAGTRVIRELIVRMNRQHGTTILLTTHNMKEAGDHKARWYARMKDRGHRVAIINKGRIVAIDSPDALRGRSEALRSVEVVFAGDNVLRGEMLSAIEGVDEVEPLPRGVRLLGANPGGVAREVACLSREKDVRIESIRTCEPTLEDVFVRMTADVPKEGRDD